MTCGHPECTRVMDWETNGFKGFNFDHVRALSMGGEHDITNLWILCCDHHNEKSAAEKSFVAYGVAMPDWVPGNYKGEVAQLDIFENQTKTNLQVTMKQADLFAEYGGE